MVLRIKAKLSEKMKMVFQWSSPSGIVLIYFFNPLVQIVVYGDHEFTQYSIVKCRYISRSCGCLFLSMKSQRLRSPEMLKYWRFDCTWSHCQSFHREWWSLHFIGEIVLIIRLKSGAALVVSNVNKRVRTNEKYKWLKVIVFITHARADAGWRRTCLNCLLQNFRNTFTLSTNQFAHVCFAFLNHPHECSYNQLHLFLCSFWLLALFVFIYLILVLKPTSNSIYRAL